MSRRKEPAIPNELLDQLLAGGAASAAFDQGGLLDSLKKALTERALNAEMDHHLAGEDGAGNTRNGYGRKTVMTETGKLAIDVSPDLISTVTDAVLDEIATWQQRPLDPVYPLVFFDALRVKIRDEGMVRNKAIHIALRPRRRCQGGARPVARAERGRQVLAEGDERASQPRHRGHPARRRRRSERLSGRDHRGVPGGDRPDLHRSPAA